MKYRQTIQTTAELASWYDNKYQEMQGTWHTPPEECNRHLDALGVPFDMSKTLLDVGCGGGHLLEQAEKRVQTWGLDISHQAIYYAYQRCKRTYLDRSSVDAPRLVGAYDYIISLGSLEHVIDLDRALDNIHDALTPDGRWYFYVPNEKWIHEDQPNERTCTDWEWFQLFSRHGLRTISFVRYEDNTAFLGVRKP